MASVDFSSSSCVDQIIEPPRQQQWSRLLAITTSGSAIICPKLFVVLLMLIAVVGTSVAQPQKPIVTANDEVDESDLACAACLAAVDVLDKGMTKKSFDGLETRLYDLLDKVCEQNNYRTYDFIPPKMAEACRKLMDKTDDEELIKVFVKFYSSSTKRSTQDRNLLERKICLSMSGACVGNKRMEGKSKPSKHGAETPEDDKQFAENVDDLMKKHAHKIKKPVPVKNVDEL